MDCHENVRKNTFVMPKVWWARQDLNLRPSLCKSDILTRLDDWPNLMAALEEAYKPKLSLLSR